MIKDNIYILGYHMFIYGGRECCFVFVFFFKFQADPDSFAGCPIYLNFDFYIFFLHLYTFFTFFTFMYKFVTEYDFKNI